MSIQLVPSEVLAHLNSMGYRNITAEQLKEFMKDLKRLIKYENRYSLQSPNIASAESPLLFQKNNVQDAPDHFEKLYKTSTEATKARLRAKSKKDNKENDNPYDPDKFDRISIGDAHCPCPRKANQTQNIKKSTTNQLTQTSASTLTKENCRTIENVKMNQPPRASSAPSSVTHYIRNTPTDLYQNYQREWSRFKHLLPGEHPRVNERQVIRRRMETIQKFQQKSKVYVHINEDNTKVIKRLPKECH